MIKILKKYDYLLPLIAMVLFFLTQRDAFPIFIYTILMIFIGLYFFPLKDLIFGDNLKLKERNINFLGLFANFILCVLLVISVPVLYLRDNGSIDIIIKTLALINFAFLIYYYFKDDDGKRTIIHLSFVLFTSALIA